MNELIMNELNIYTAHDVIMAAFAATENGFE
jgi:hypothetical protein